MVVTLLCGSSGHAATSILSDKTFFLQGWRLSRDSQDISALQKKLQKKLTRQRQVNVIYVVTPEQTAAKLWARTENVQGISSVGTAELKCLLGLLELTQKNKWLGREYRVRCEKRSGVSMLTHFAFHLDGRLDYLIQPMPPFLAVKTTSIFEIHQRHGIGDFRENGRSWSPIQLAFVEQALALMNPREIALLHGLPFERARRSTRRTVGSYIGEFEPGQSRIAIYDDGTMVTKKKQIPAGRFGGDYYAQRVWTVVHEIGHALADSQRRLSVDSERPAEEDVVHAALRCTYEMLNQKTDEYNEFIVDQPRKVAEIDRRKIELNSLNKDYEDLVQEYGRLAEEKKRMTKQIDAEGHVVERSFSELFPVAQGVTSYGRSRASEHFAEAYAMYKISPDILKRISLSAFKFFESGDYLKLIEREIEDAPVGVAWPEARCPYKPQSLAN